MSHKKIILILCLGLFLSAERNINAQGTLTYVYTGSVQTWTVPCNVTSITLDCYGAQGIGVYNEYHPGYGGEARGVMAVLPGETFYLYVGGQSGWNGGGIGQSGANGGDGTDVRFGGNTYADRIIVAGGGGGAGGDNWGCTNVSYGNGGGGTAIGTNFVGGGGGEGYTSGTGCGTSGANKGGAGGVGYHGGGGGGGGFIGGGAGATTTGCSGTADSGHLGAGGASFNAPGCAYEGTGGGGGGYYGGGGAAGCNCGSGQGGGGSSWTGTLTSPYFHTGSWTGTGKIVISYNNAPTPITDSAAVVSEVSCNGGGDGQAVAIVTGAAPSSFTYSWAPGGESTDTASGLSAGTYVVTVSNQCGGPITATVTITQPAILFDTAYTVTNVLCNGGSNGSATVVANGAVPYTYLWEPSSQLTQTASNLTAGTYTVVVGDACGFTVSSTITITQPNKLMVADSVTANVSCYGLSNGSISSMVMDGTGPYTYAWSPAGGLTDTAVGLSAGSYKLTVTDNNGCVSWATATVTQPALLTVAATVNAAVNCNGFSDGSVMATPNGGTGPYNYLWTGGQSTATASGLPIGIYTVTLTDSHGCSATAKTTITQPTAISIFKNITPDNGGCTGSAWVMVNGGVLPYTYLWSNGKTNAYNYGICASNTSYCCTVTDAHGCIDTACMDVYSDAGVASVSDNAGITVYPNPNNGQFTIHSAGGNGQAIVEVYNVLGANIYTGTINSSNGGDNTINISNQPNGIYLYRVMSSTNGTLLGEGKIVVNK